LCTENPGELPVYNWHASVLAKANASAEHVTALLRKHVSLGEDESILALKDWINNQIVIPLLGIRNALDSELHALASDPDSSLYVFSGMVSRRARIGWSTHGHSAVDVNIYSSGGPGTGRIRGNVENTDIGKFLRDYLGVDVDNVTDELRKKMDLGPPPKREVLSQAREEDRLHEQAEESLAESPMEGYMPNKMLGDW
jgi:alkaline phosphatase